MATFNTLVIESADREGANTFWENAGAGPNTFFVGLVPASGQSNATITHYFASGQLERFFPSAHTEFPVEFPSAVMLRFVGSGSDNYDYVEGQLAILDLKRYNPIV